FGHGVEAERATGVVDEDVKFSATNLRSRPSDKFFHAVRLANVERMKVCLRRAGFARLGGDRLQPIHAPRAEQQSRTFRAERARRACAESARCAGDDEPFVFQIEVHASRDNPAGWEAEILFGVASVARGSSAGESSARSSQ